MLTRYGTDNIIVMIAIGLAFLLSYFYSPKLWMWLPLSILGFVLILFALWFFRDPDRTIPQEAVNDTSIVLAPADGKIVEIIEEYEPHYVQDKVRRISIFLSPLDVHVNRSPFTGKVEFYNYNPGKYLIAYHPKSSELNEQSRIGVMTENGKVLFKQIVGIVARRLVCELKVGDEVKSGEKFGMMKFGSRMDIMLPLSAEIFIKIGDKVVAGETIIAKMK